MINGEDPDEISHMMAFHQDLYCLLNQFPEKYNIIQKIKPVGCDPLLYATGHSHLTLLNCTENCIGLKRVK